MHYFFAIIAVIVICILIKLDEIIFCSQHGIMTYVKLSIAVGLISLLLINIPPSLLEKTKNMLSGSIENSNTVRYIDDDLEDLPMFKGPMPIDSKLNVDKLSTNSIDY